MKFKIELEKGETIEDAEEFMMKSVKKKRECSHGERYCDNALNEFIDDIESKHNKLVESITEEIAVKVRQYASRR